MLWFSTSGRDWPRMSMAMSMRPRKSGTRVSMVVFGDASRTARTTSTKCWAPPSRRSSRSTLVITTYCSLSMETELASSAGSSGLGGSGWPWPTSQNGQRRVQISPRIMKGAVPRPKHSPMFGQAASSQTVCSFFSRSMALISPKRPALLPALTRIHSGLRSGSFTGTLVSGERNIQVFGLDDLQASIAAGVDRSKGGKIHIDVERDAVIGAAVTDAQAERGDLGRADINAGSAVAPLGG